MIRIIVILFLMLGTVIKLLAQDSFLNRCPKVDLSIKLDKDTFNVGEDIQVMFLIINNTRKAHNIVFDRPKSATGGPAYTFVSLIELKTGTSVLKYGNKRILESRLYSDVQLKDSSYYLAPKAYLKRKFNLFDLAVTILPDYRLAEGRYELQVYYCTSQSNKLRFVVK